MNRDEIIKTALLLRLNKEALRKQLRERLRGMPEARRAEASAKACALLARQQVWREAKAVLFYAALPDEIDLGALLEKALAEGKIVAFRVSPRKPGLMRLVK